MHMNVDKPGDQPAAGSVYDNSVPALRRDPVSIRTYRDFPENAVFTINLSVNYFHAKCTL